jgi:hypothetical protein
MKVLYHVDFDFTPVKGSAEKGLWLLQFAHSLSKVGASGWRTRNP